MKKIVILFLFIVLNSFTTTESTVYLCGPKGASKYHYSENCRGLNACKHEVVKKTLKEAKELGLTLCGWEN